MCSFAIGGLVADINGMVFTYIQNVENTRYPLRFAKYRRAAINMTKKLTEEFKIIIKFLKPGLITLEDLAS